MRDNEYMSDEELEALIAGVEENEMLHAPIYLKDRILEQARKESVEENVIAISTKSARTQFRMFRFRVALATAAAVIVLFIAPAEIKMTEAATDSYEQTQETFSKKITGKSNQLCEMLSKITNQLISKED